MFARCRAKTYNQINTLHGKLFYDFFAKVDGQDYWGE
jgi:hypothetical protein